MAEAWLTRKSAIRSAASFSCNFPDYRSFGKGVRHGGEIVYVCREASNHGYSPNTPATLLVIVCDLEGRKKRFTRIQKAVSDDLIDPSVIAIDDEFLIVASNRLDGGETINETFVYSSTDGGRTWAQKSVIATPYGFDFVKAYNLYQLPMGDLLLFSYMRPSVDPDARVVRVWRSEDGGATWASNGADISDVGEPFMAEPAAVIVSDSEWVVVVRRIITTHDSQPSQFSTTDGGQTWVSDGKLTGLSMGTVSPSVQVIGGTALLWFADRANGKIGFCSANAAEVVGDPSAWSDPVFVADQLAVSQLEFGYPSAVHTGRDTLVFHYDTEPPDIRAGIRCLSLSGATLVLPQDVVEMGGIRFGDTALALDFRSEADIELIGGEVSGVVNRVTDTVRPITNRPAWEPGGVVVAPGDKLFADCDLTGAEGVTFLIVVRGIPMAATVLLDQYIIGGSQDGMLLRFDPQSGTARLVGRPTGGDLFTAQISGISYSGGRVAFAGSLRDGVLTVAMRDAGGFRFSEQVVIAGAYATSLRHVAIGYAPGTQNGMTIERVLMLRKGLSAGELNVMMDLLF